jgi:hypothetical protein
MSLEMTSEQEERIMSNFAAQVDALLGNSSSGKEFLNNLETSNSEQAIAREDDGIDPLSYDDDSDEEFEESVQETPVSQTMYDGTEKSDNILDFERFAKAQHRRDEKQNTGYFKNSEESKPVTQEDIKENFEDVNLDDLQARIIAQTDDILKREQPKFYQAKQKAAQSKKTEWASDDIAYHDSTYSSNGEVKQFRKAVQHVDWGEILQKDAKTPAEGLDRLRSYITYNIKKYFGGFNRINTIVVRDQQLIINDVCYMPAIEKKYVNPQIFPVDTIDYIESGCIASFFNWRYLKEMTNVVLIDIDDPNFYTTVIADDIGVGRRIGVSSLFNICHNLNTLIIGGEAVTQEELHKPESLPIKEKVSVSKRFMNFSDGYKINVYANTNGLQNYTFTNLKNYATNRGNKGLFHFCCGTVARAGLAGIAGAVNLGAHIIGGIKNVLVTATTPVSEDEF